MKNQPKTLQDAIQYFSNEKVCIQTVAEMRWADGKPACPACGNKEHYWLESQKRWKCKECWKQFSVKVGTIFEDSPISLTKWLPALWLVVNCKNGISSYELAKDLGVSQKSAWFMLHRIRLALQVKHDTKMGGGGWREVEVDETFVGGKLRNMHKDKKVIYNKRGGSHGKAVVVGLLDRSARQIRATVVPNVKRETLQAQVLQHVQHGTSVYTDSFSSYDKLKLENYIHDFVNHAEKYVDGRVHTNGIENFWSLLKRGLTGTYVAVEPFHLFRYVDEQVFRFNSRLGENKKPLPDSERFYKALSQIAGKRLTFAEVTGKVGETAA